MPLEKDPDPEKDYIGKLRFLGEICPRSWMEIFLHWKENKRVIFFPGDGWRRIDVHHPTRNNLIFYAEPDRLTGRKKNKMNNHIENFFQMVDSDRKVRFWVRMNGNEWRPAAEKAGIFAELEAMEKRVEEEKSLDLKPTKFRWHHRYDAYITHKEAREVFTMIRGYKFI